ncbi:sucrose utilization protein SUC1 like [Verticillium longisporum]|nr:sucrose utilization protein SUC1 like [Verticillium longisporum]
MDPGCLLSKLALPQGLVSPSLGRFFAAMSAAVIVQLNLTDPNVDGLDVAQTSGQVLSMRLADKYISQCFAGRHDRSYIEDADEWTIMESFFIFSYYGNCNTSKQAWYHLREAISFALALGLNREESYSDPSLEVNERRRRLYWLLFITERAYCLQHRTTPILRASIALPRIYDGADEPTLSGFVKLARLFNTIDTDFRCQTGDLRISRYWHGTKNIGYCRFSL